MVALANVTVHTIDPTENTSKGIFLANLAADLAAIAGVANAANPGSVPTVASNSISTAGAINMSGAQVASALNETILTFTGTNASNVAYKLPSVAACVAALQAVGINPVPGFSWIFSLLNFNVDADTLTFTADTGNTWTLTNTTPAIPQFSEQSWAMTLTSLTAGTAKSLGTTPLTTAGKP